MWATHLPNVETECYNLPIKEKMFKIISNQTLQFRSIPDHLNKGAYENCKQWRHLKVRTLGSLQKNDIDFTLQIQNLQSSKLNCYHL